MINVMQLQLQPETLVNITLPHGYFLRFLKRTYATNRAKHQK